MLGSWRRDPSHLPHLQPPSKVFWPQEDQEHGPSFIEFIFWLESLLGAIWGKRCTYGSAHREEHSSTDFAGAGGQLRTHCARTHSTTLDTRGLDDGGSQKMRSGQRLASHPQEHNLKTFQEPDPGICLSS